ncbi:unnamed protein product [Anisakis simplex]|uniref:BBS1 domain-containing protein n=1 Tax=Anisakis simplex TaxID=6269 RepID=A0A0M3KGE4_ANISI|nr:unnamed protein product [Anisakis simplex]
MARKSPQQLSKDVPFIPRSGFQWTDNNQVLVEDEQFVIYDAYWNVPTFKGNRDDYFTNLSRDMIGITIKTDALILVYTSSNTIQIYDAKRRRVMQEYPIEVHKFVGCLKE